MKKLYTLISAVILSASLWAQAPQKMSYQAVIRGANNALVIDKPVGVRISILQGSETGSTVYTETQTPTTNANGLASFSIGAGKNPSSDFSKIDWSKGPYFVKTETDVAGGTNYQLTTVSELMSVPYAIHAKTAESIVGGNAGNNSGSFTHYIGEEFGGGVIFHLWKDKLGVEHGLVVATKDQSTAKSWSNVTNVEIGDQAKSKWDGVSNTDAIIKQLGHNSSAAKLCSDLVLGGQSDWYLPSIQELSILWNNYFTVVKSLAQIPGATELAFDCYWSSTEGSNTRVWASCKGGITFNPKDGEYYVRAVRSF